MLEQHQPQTVIVDPISSLLSVGSIGEVRDMLIRLLDLLKTKNINAYFTSLTHESTMEPKDLTVNAVSSLADIWIDMENEEINNRRIRSFRIVKARGMGHETETRQFIINNKGIKLLKTKSE